MNFPKLLRITGTSFNKLKQRVVKVIGSSKSTLTAEEYSSFGIDSNPPKDLTAIYMRTEADGDECIIGYLLKDKLAEVGETRLFSTDSDLGLKSYVWLKNDGTILINGDNNNAVLFNELKTEFNKLKQDHNTLVQKWNAFCSAYAPGSPSSLGTPPTLATSTVTANSSNIDNAKNAKIKTNS